MPDQPPPAPARPGSPAPADKPVLPQRSLDESDIGWGERPDLDEDDRLRQDRPPHWDPR